MMSPHYVTDGLPVGQVDGVVMVVLIVVSLLLIFAGRRLVKTLIFMAAGLVGGSFSAALASTYLGGLGYLLGWLVGFLVAGLLAVLLLPVAIGLVIAFLSYRVAHIFVAGSFPLLVISIVAFVVGAMLSDRVVSLASVVFGGMMLFEAFILLGVSVPVSGVITFTVAGAGYLVQSEELRKPPVP